MQILGRATAVYQFTSCYSPKLKILDVSRWNVYDEWMHTSLNTMHIIYYSDPVLKIKIYMDAQNIIKL